MTTPYTGEYTNVAIPQSLLHQAHLDSGDLSFELHRDGLLITRPKQLPYRSDFTPHESWPTGIFTSYYDDSFPGVSELRADWIEPRQVDL